MTVPWIEEIVKLYRNFLISRTLKKIKIEKKMLQAFKCTQHPKAGRNTKQIPRKLDFGRALGIMGPIHWRFLFCWK